VTAFLAFVPKTSGMVAIIKLLATLGGTYWAFPPEVTRLLWALAALSMTFGNVLGLLQDNVKRVLAYSSIAHSGYMLVGLTALTAAGASTTNFSEAARIRDNALQGVYFYLAAYGIMNTAAFGVLMLLPSRAYREARLARRRGHADDLTPPATTAETYEDLAGQGRRHPLLGLAMAVSCFSLIGLPLTVGFFGKLYLIKPALDAKLVGLVVVTLVNAAISAAYYLQIVATLFLRPDPATAEAMESDLVDAAAEQAATEKYPRRVFPIGAAVALSAGLTLLFGAVFPATEQLAQRVHEAALAHPQPPATVVEGGVALDAP
jgi:NADH-quinone oxidoreductase subunit N